MIRFENQRREENRRWRDRELTLVRYAYTAEISRVWFGSRFI
jgi:hypothetical protein